MDTFDQKSLNQLVGHAETYVAQLQQAGPELIFVRVTILLDEAMGLQRLEQAVHGRPGQAKPVGELAHAQPARTAGERFQDGRRTVDRLDRAALSLLFRIRHC